MTTGGIMDDAFEFDLDPEDDEDSLAETQQAIENERDERDAAASEALDAHERLREELHGNSLLWWQDTSLFNAHVAMGHLFGEVRGELDVTKALIAHGLDQDTMTVEVPLNILTGPLVLCALQLLGLFVPETREEITELLKSFPFPVATQDEAEAIERATAKINSERRAAFFEIEKALAHEQDAGLGIDLN